jgi:diaminopimelate decarboxylase
MQVSIPVCESADTFGLHWLPALRRGDLVAISGTGAYGSAQATTYNGRPRSPEVFIHSGGDLELARARQQVALPHGNRVRRSPGPLA